MPISSAASNPADASTSSTKSAASSGTKALGDEQIFLQLLVAQIKNQDPTKPVDSTQFMTQLAQFSNLEQLISLNTTVGKIGTAVGVPPDTDQSTSSGSSSS
jgi:flagellar basal-body rod modification protein FlgD